MTEHVSATIGATPLIKLERLSEEIGATVYVKFEASNPGGSIKDRAAMNMIDAAEDRGEIAPGRSVLVEPTSGNTGIGIAMIGAARGYDVVLTMPESMSKERRMLLAAYGAKLVLTPAAEGMAGAVAEAERIERETPGAWIVGQFTNPDNPAAHEKTTGPEIKKALGGVNPDYVVAAAGTGGTISGVAHFFNGHGKFRPGGLVDLVGERVRIYAVEPDESPLISQSLAGEELTPAPHGIQGIGANFVPETLDLDVLDGALRVTTEEAYGERRSASGGHFERSQHSRRSQADRAASRSKGFDHRDFRGRHGREVSFDASV